MLNILGADLRIWFNVKHALSAADAFNEANESTKVSIDSHTLANQSDLQPGKLVRAGAAQYRSTPLA